MHMHHHHHHHHRHLHHLKNQHLIVQVIYFLFLYIIWLFIHFELIHNNVTFVFGFIESSYDFSGKKHKRGKSCGKGLHYILEANDGKKMPVIFDLKHQVPSDDKVGALFSSEIGNIVQTSAPVCHLGWKNVSTDDKGKMRDSLTVS